MKLLPALTILLCVAADPVKLTPAERAQFAREQMADVNQLVGDLPSEPPRKLSDVVGFEWIDGRLLPSTPLAGSFRKNQPLIDDTARCLIQRYQQRSLSYILDFQLKRFDPRTLAVETVKLSRFGNGTIMSLIVVDVDQTLHIQITDTQSPDDNGEPSPVRLFWQNTPTENDDAQLQSASTSSLEARTLLDLIRNHRTVAVPILRRLFYSLRRPDIIGQALNPLWVRSVKSSIKIPQQLSDDVNRLVVQLDADEYAVRQQAFDALAAMKQDAQLVLIRIEQIELSAEQRSSISALLEPLADIDAQEIERVSNSPIDLVDGLCAPHPAVREAIRLRIETLTKSRLDIDTATLPSIETIEAIRERIRKLSDH